MKIGYNLVGNFFHVIRDDIVDYFETKQKNHMRKKDRLSRKLDLPETTSNKIFDS